MDFPYLRRIEATAEALTVQEHIWQEVAISYSLGLAKLTLQ